MYKHTDHQNQYYSLIGFLNSAYCSLNQLDRIALCLTQLEKYFVKVVYDYIDYQEAIWRNEKYTFLPYESAILPIKTMGIRSISKHMRLIDYT